MVCLNAKRRSLVMDYITGPQPDAGELTVLRHFAFLGETVDVPGRIPNPWMLVSQCSLVLLVIFVADAAITVWKRDDRQRSQLVGVASFSSSCPGQARRS